MRQTSNLGLSLYDASDKMNITGAENSLNHNMELIDEAIHNIPAGDKGNKGDSATVEIGTVTTLPAGSQATVQNVGTASNAVLNFGIPKGYDGDPGEGLNTDLSAYRTSAEQDTIDSELDEKIETTKQLFNDTINITTTGITPTVKRAILNCFANVAWLSSDGAERYKELYNALNAEPDLTPVPVPPSICIVSTSLSNCSVDSEGITDVIYGGEYRAVISTLAGYMIYEVTVGMGGLAIDAYNAETGEIIIPEVTGNIIIIASAKPYLDVNIPISDFKRGYTITNNPNSEYVTFSSSVGRQCYVGKTGIGVANCIYRITPVFVSGVENTSLSFASQRANRENVDNKVGITKKTDTGWISGFGTDKTYFDITDSFDSYIWLVINSSNDVSNIISHFNIKIVEES